MLRTPDIPASCFVAPSATVVGYVTLGENVSVYYGTVIRSETAIITVGEGTNIQDACVLHADRDYPVTVGKGCTVGHGAIIHGCTIGENTLVGMGAIILNGAVVGNNCIIGAGALVTQGTIVPDGSMAIGAPAKVRRELTEGEIEANRESAQHYNIERLSYKELHHDI